VSLYLNSSGIDSVRNAVMKCSQDVQEIFLASPFFSYDDIINEMRTKCSLIRLIVRLGPATSPIALRQIIDHPEVQIRYFTSRKFHSKLYIFGDKKALIGSANFTIAGLQSNREICIEIDKNNTNFDKLVAAYSSYWNDAEVLSKERLASYEKIYLRSKYTEEKNSLESDLGKEFEDVSPGKGVQVGKKKQSKEKIFLESYRKTYQEFHYAFKEVETVYKEDGRRKQKENAVPLRIEIDQFFSFVREEYATGDSYNLEPNRSGNAFRTFVKGMLDEGLRLIGTIWTKLYRTIIKKLIQPYLLKKQLMMRTLLKSLMPSWFVIPLRIDFGSILVGFQQ